MKRIISILALAFVTKFSLGQTGVNVFRQLDVREFLGTTVIVDSSTDFRSALQQAINVLTTGPNARGGIIHVPGKNIYISGTVYDTVSNASVSTPITIMGDGGMVTSYVTGTHSVAFHQGPSYLFTTATNDTMFVVSGTSSMSFENVGIGYSGASTTPGNIGVYYYNGNNFHMNNVSFFGFDINCDIKNGALWAMNNVYFNDAHTYNLRYQDSILPDYGDARMTNVWFTTQTARGTGVTHFRYGSGGGLTAVGLKFNSGSNFYAANCVDASGWGGTVDAKFFGGSYENFSGQALILTPALGVNNFEFYNNQIDRGSGAGSGTAPVILVNSLNGGIKSLNISGNIMNGNSNTDTAIQIIRNVSHAISPTTISGNAFTNFKANLITSGYAATDQANNVPPQTVQALTESGGHIKFDPTLGNAATVTISGNDTLDLVNGLYGQQVTLYVTQNGTGGFHLVVAAGNIPQNSANVTLNAAAGASTVLHGFTYGGYIILDNVARSFTTGSIPFFNFGMIENNGQLYWDNSANILNVGAPGTAELGQISVGTNTGSFTPSLSAKMAASSALGPIILAGHQRGTLSSGTALSVNDYLGHFVLAGHDGTAQRYSAIIDAYVDSAVSSNSVPATLAFHSGYTTDIDPRGNGDISMSMDHRGRIGMGNMQTTDTALVTIGNSGAFGTFNNGANGNILSIRQINVNNWGPSTTTSIYSGVTIRAPINSAINAQTYTDAPTVYIEGRPIQSTNVTQTNSEALLLGGIAKYTANFGSLYNSRTLPDKNYVDSAIAAGSGSGVTTVGTFSGSSQTNGASISTNTITFGPADATNPGMVSTGTQTFAGAKTFNSIPTVGTASAGDNSTKAASTAYVDGLVSSNTFTSTLTNTTNISTSTFLSATYTKVGNVVIVRIAADVTPTSANTASVLTFSLPFTTSTTTQTSVGHGSQADNGGTSYVSGICSVVSGTTATFNFISGALAGSGHVNVILTYTL